MLLYNHLPSFITSLCHVVKNYCREFCCYSSPRNMSQTFT